MTSVAGTARAVEVVESPVPVAERSPCDVLRLAIAAGGIVVVLLIQWLAGDELVSHTEKLLRGLDEIPSWLVTGVVAGTWIVGVIVVLGGLVWSVAKGDWRALYTIVLATALAAVLTALLGLGSEPTARAVGNAADTIDDIVRQATLTEILLAGAMALATACAPWVSRRFRRLTALLVLGLVLSRALVTPIALSSMRGLLIGWFSGALVLVLLGAPPRRPRAASIANGLAAVGVPLRRIEQASLDARGSTPYFAETVDDRKLFVKALGRDERSADLLFRAYRYVLPRNLGDERGYLSLRRAVEHEALLAFAARDLGVRTPRFVALASADPAAFVLSYEAIDGKSLDRVPAEDVTDQLLEGIWRQVAILRSRRLAHRDLRLANVFVAADGEVWMIDFGFSELAASDTLLSTDLAELLAATAIVVGPERAARAARRILGNDVKKASGRLQLWALSGATRTAMKEPENTGLLDRLRSEARR